MPMPPSLPSPGQIAPSLRLRGAAGKALILEPFEGQPIVLAFLEGWSPRSEGTAFLESIRAELRGLGAVLVALTRDALWCFRPDDEMQAFASRAELDPRDVAALRSAYGVGESASEPGVGAADRKLGLFVIDGRKVVAFAHVARLHGDDESAEMLLGALSTAGRALVSAPRPRSLFLSRREVVAASLVAGFAMFLLDACHRRDPSPSSPSVSPSSVAAAAGPGHVISGDVDLTLDINGSPRTVRVEPRVSLLDALRERVGMTGTKKGCDHGQCGACTVLVDGRRVNACLTLAIAVQGTRITTIEGLARGSELHPMQAAFVADDALQCGYCTPGQLMSAMGMLAEGHAHSDDEVRDAMSGNICRCGAYANIVVAIQRARGAA
jgi:xanthine dehydrogenase YagT iron-sulfur-binding subunit